MKKITSILPFLLIALLALLPLQGEAQSITRNKKQQTTKTTTKKSKQGSSSSNSGKSKKANKTTSHQSFNRSNGMTQAQKNRIIQKAIDDMVWVEGGTFTMGATSEQGDDARSDEMPAHQVTLSSFYISKYEVTQELWVAVMGKNPSSYKGDIQRPVENVSWEDCQVFISKLNKLTGKRFRLPTEAEWEYAARGGKQSRGYKYSGSNNLDAVAWYSQNREGNTTSPVGQKSPNELGLYDMSGNVSEYCQDFYNTYRKTMVEYDRVNRGGDLYSPAVACRVSDRGIYPTRGHGLRLAM